MKNSVALESNFSSASSFKSHLQPWVVCFSAALFFFYEFIQMNMFNSISLELMESFHVSGSQLGNLSATYLYADVLFLLPAGIILDRVSVRKVILAAMSLCVSGTLLFSQATSFGFAAACHFIAGIGNAFSFLSCMMLASRWFPPKRLALVTGLIVTFAMAGGMVAQTPLTLLVQEIGWRHAVFANGLLGIVLLFINWLFIQNYPTGQSNRQTAIKTVSFFESIRLAVRNINTWLYAFYTSFLNLPIMVLGALWGTLALHYLHGLTDDDASLVTSMIFLGTIIGGPSMGWISDKLSLRKLPMIISGLFSLAIILIIIYGASLTLSELIILFLLLGFFTSAQVISYPAITETNSHEITGTAVGLASVIIMGGGAVAQPLFGWLLNYHWNHIFKYGKPFYTTANFDLAMLMLPIAFIVGIISVILARETHCKSVSEN